MLEKESITWVSKFLQLLLRPVERPTNIHKCPSELFPLKMQQDRGLVAQEKLNYAEPPYFGKKKKRVEIVICGNNRVPRCLRHLEFCSRDQGWFQKPQPEFCRKLNPCFGDSRTNSALPAQASGAMQSRKGPGKVAKKPESEQALHCKVESKRALHCKVAKEMQIRIALESCKSASTQRVAELPKPARTRRCETSKHVALGKLQARCVALALHCKNFKHVARQNLQTRCICIASQNLQTCKVPQVPA